MVLPFSISYQGYPTLIILLPPWPFEIVCQKLCALDCLYFPKDEGMGLSTKNATFIYKKASMRKVEAFQPYHAQRLSHPKV